MPLRRRDGCTKQSNRQSALRRKNKVSGIPLSLNLTCHSISVGVVPSEYSTGDKTSRFSITKTGNAHLRRAVVEAAWQYQRRPLLGRTVKARRKDQPKAIVDIAEKCEKRLHARFQRLTSRNKKSTVAVVAVARELLGFIWAIGQIAHP